MRFFATAAVLLPMIFTGCAMTPTAAPLADAGVTLHGAVHGGQQPIVGGHVYLFAANTTGYGGNGIAASPANASISLLQSGSGTTLDTGGGPTNGDYFVTTAADGSFSIGGGYTCTPGQQVYLYAQGGNPGSGVNSAVGAMAILGSCPSASNFASATPFVAINEVSTIAAAYAFAGFASDAVHVSSSGSALAQTGIANAFANAANLASLATGTALTTTPAGNGTTPQATVNTLANILAACVNSAGPTSTGCATLFTDAMSSGSTGTAATDTATAAIDIAHNPGANIAALYGNTTANPPFSPTLARQPNDFTLGITFGYNLTGFATTNMSPVAIAIDAAGNAWLANQNPSLGVMKLSPTGAVLSGSKGYVQGIGQGPLAGSIAIDGFGNAWVTATSNVLLFKLSSSGAALLEFSPANSAYYTAFALSGAVAIDGANNVWIVNKSGSPSGWVTEVSNSGTLLLGANGLNTGTLNGPQGIAIDGSGRAWVADSIGNDLTRISGSATSTYTGGGLNRPYPIALDSSGSAWTGNYNGNGLTVFSNSGALTSGANGYPLSTGTGSFVSVAFDGAGNAWVGNANGTILSELSSTGSVLSPAGGYKGSLTGGQVQGVAVDGSGNVWLAGAGTTGTSPYMSFSAITEVIGAATPVITPISAGLPATPNSNGTSNLGTRP